MSVIFIIRTTFIFATAAFSRFGLLLSMTVVFWVWALLCALGLRRLLIYWRSWLQSYYKGMKVPVSFSHLQPDKHGSHFCISWFNAPNNKHWNKDSLVSVRKIFKKFGSSTCLLWPQFHAITDCDTLVISLMFQNEYCFNEHHQVF